MPARHIKIQKYYNRIRFILDYHDNKPLWKSPQGPNVLIPFVSVYLFSDILTDTFILP